MPIKSRIDMLTTGIRTPVGLKIQGADAEQIQEIGRKSKRCCAVCPGTRSVFSERTGDGYFLDFDLGSQGAGAQRPVDGRRAECACRRRSAAKTSAPRSKGRERYPINVRYMRDFRSRHGRAGRVLVPASGEKQIPLAELATIQHAERPSDDSQRRRVADRLCLRRSGRPGRRATTWRKARAELQKQAAICRPVTACFGAVSMNPPSACAQRLKLVVPVTLAIILFLLYCNTRSMVKTAIIMLAVPFSAVGAIWLLYLLGYNMSIAVWVGLIALLGVDAETGVFMLLYLDLAYEKAKREHARLTRTQLCEAIVDGAAKRLRPKFMTFATMFVGLVPIMWSTGSGFGRHEAHRGAHGRRHLYLVPAGVAGLSGDLRVLARE